MSDNFKIDICNIGDSELEIALGVAFRQSPGSKTTHYVKKSMPSTAMFANEDKSKIDTLIFLWHQESDSIAFPAELSCKEASAVASKFLTSVKCGPEPQHDGSNELGFRVFNENWGHVGGYCYAVVGVQPCWMMYGK